MRYDLKGHELLVETLQKISDGIEHEFSYYKDVLDEETNILSYPIPKHLYRIGTKMANGIAIFQYIDDFDRFPTREDIIVQLEAGHKLAKEYLDKMGGSRLSEEDLESMPPNIRTQAQLLAENDAPR